MNDKYISVNQLTKYIKYKIDNDVNLNEVFLRGEISNFKAHSRGHFYFTLKDEKSRISAIMFASATIINMLSTATFLRRIRISWLPNVLTKLPS